MIPPDSLIQVTVTGVRRALADNTLEEIRLKLGTSRVKMYYVVGGFVFNTSKVTK